MVYWHVYRLMSVSMSAHTVWSIRVRLKTVPCMAIFFGSLVINLKLNMIQGVYV